MLKTVDEVEAAVDIRPLKAYVSAKFRSSSYLRKVLTQEPDLVPAAEFVGKLGTWLAILKEDLES